MSFAPKKSKALSAAQARADFALTWNLPLCSAPCGEPICTTPAHPLSQTLARCGTRDTASVRGGRATIRGVSWSCAAVALQRRRDAWVFGRNGQLPPVRLPQRHVHSTARAARENPFPKAPYFEARQVRGWPPGSDEVAQMLPVHPAMLMTVHAR
jgi:hypothetical protein